MGKKHVLVRLKGGLGNQMFIYAFAYALDKMGYEVAIIKNIPKQEYTPRRFELTRFTLSLPLLESDDPILRKYKRARWIPRVIDISLAPTKRIRLNEPAKANLPNPIKECFLARRFQDFAQPDGCFQDLTYLQHIADDLISQYSLKEPLDPHDSALKERIIATPDSIALHIRRGDYLKLDDIYVHLGRAYYDSALHLMRKSLARPYVYVFSNDITWCKTRLPEVLDLDNLAGVEYISSSSEDDATSEFELMRACKHFIIANSTFSWWAAYLGGRYAEGGGYKTSPDTPKIVVMPSRFFYDGLRLPQAEMLCPQGWIRIEHVFGEVVL